ncbi:MAG TPA: AMP-binding protein [Gaiellaceae bacterium]|nr:AMP-binding protein [Gaiellaceae bacterium]
MIVDSKPWLRFYGDVPETLDYPEITLYEAVARSAAKRPDAVAIDFLDATLTYRELVEAIDRCAAALAALGVEAEERITISTPTCPQGVIAFYAAAKLGAVASMIHPLSTPSEIAGYLTISRSRVALTLDAFYSRFAEVRDRTPLETLVLARIPDYLPIMKRLGFWWTRGRKIPSIPADARVRWWSRLMREEQPPASAGPASASDLAALLYSGGTTGAPKAIMLSHRNFISEGMQVAAWVGLDESDTVLAVLPIFHGFGLGALINAALLSGAKVVMVPVYGPDVVAKLLRTKRPTLTAGPPTLYESLARDPSLRRADLSSLRAAFSGADTLPATVRERFERLVTERGGRVRLLEGYGLTEAVTAIMGMPLHEYRPESIGIPFPDIVAEICEPGTTRQLPPGEEGEICVSGPAVMLGYLDDPEATAAALKAHDDGRVWLHTGDIGRRDEDGFFYFTSRSKRMIKSSGFNVYPAQVEAVLYRHPAVAEACVVGVPDEAQGERVKAFVVAEDAAGAGPALAAELIEYCREHLIKWSCPRDVEFLDELPKTRMGKIDYVALMERDREP